MGERNPSQELSAATSDVLAAFSRALDSLNDATTQHKRAAIMLDEEVRHKTGESGEHT